MKNTFKNRNKKSETSEQGKQVKGCLPGSQFLIPDSCCRAAAMIFCFSLCACSTTSETFDCQGGKGVGCKSISTVNNMVDQGSLGQARLEEGEEDMQSSELPSSAPVISTASLPQQVEIPLSDEFFVRRIQEEHLRVWIAPYQDAQGNFHEGSIVHTVLKPGYWQVSDPRVADQPALNARVDDSSVDDTQASLSQARLFQTSLQEAQ